MTEFPRGIRCAIWEDCHADAVQRPALWRDPRTGAAFFGTDPPSAGFELVRLCELHTKAAELVSGHLMRVVLLDARSSQIARMMDQQARRN